MYVYIEHVVEVDPQVEEDPTMEGDGDIIWESSQWEQWASWTVVYNSSVSQDLEVHIWCKFNFCSWNIEHSIDWFSLIVLIDNTTATDPQLIEESL